jgi:hypothetical protein
LKRIKQVQFYGVAGDPVFRHAGVQSRYETNLPLICETLMNIREKYTTGELERPVRAKLLGWYLVGLLEAKSVGTDISDALAELEQAIATLPPEEQKPLRDQIASDHGRPPRITQISSKRSILGRVQAMLARSALFEGALELLVRRFGVDIDAPKLNILEISEFNRLFGRAVNRV